MNKYTEIWRLLERRPAEEYDFEEGVSEHQLIYGIGWVAHEFEYLQNTIMRLFSVVCNSNDRTWDPRLAMVLAKTASFSMKLNMVREASAHFLPDRGRKEALYKWLNLADRASQRRNDIVHGNMSISQRDDGPRQAVIEPSYYDSRRRGLATLQRKPQYRYNPKQVQDYAVAIQRTNGNVMAVVMQLSGDPPLLGDEWMLDASVLLE